MEEILGRGRTGLLLTCILKLRQETIYPCRVGGMSEEILSIDEV